MLFQGKVNLITWVYIDGLLTVGDSFGGLLVSSFGYSPERSLILFMPASAIAIVCMVSSG